MKKIIFMLTISIVSCLVFAACSNGEIISQSNSETHLFMDVNNYSENLHRTVTVKSMQSGSFEAALTKTSGKIEITITDSMGKVWLTANQNSTFPPDGKFVVNSGNGTYTINVNMKNFTGSFDISWDTNQEAST